MIRGAMLEDIPELLPLIAAFADSVDIGDISFKTTANTLAKCIQDGVVLVYDKENEIVGIIAGIASPSIWNSGKRVMEEVLFYVKEEERNKIVGHRLLSSYLATVHCMDCYGSTLKLMYNSPPLQRFYNKKGYEELETTFFRRL